VTVALVPRDVTDDPYTVDYVGPNRRGRFTVWAPSLAEAELAAVRMLADDENVVQVAAA
jgi:hypothetical protein